MQYKYFKDNLFLVKHEINYNSFQTNKRIKIALKHRVQENEDYWELNHSKHIVTKNCFI